MRRLTERTVQSGSSTWRFRALRPTRKRPVLRSSPTTDGTMGSPSMAITRGPPASITARQELVVPRSIPKIRFVTCVMELPQSRLIVPVDDDPRGAHHPLAQAVAGEDLLDHPAVREIGPVRHAAGLVPAVVKKLVE